MHAVPCICSGLSWAQLLLLRPQGGYALLEELISLWLQCSSVYDSECAPSAAAAAMGLTWWRRKARSRQAAPQQPDPEEAPLPKEEGSARASPDLGGGGSGAWFLRWGAPNPTERASTETEQYMQKYKPTGN